MKGTEKNSTLKTIIISLIICIIMVIGIVILVVNVTNSNLPEPPPQIEEENDEDDNENNNNLFIPSLTVPTSLNVEILDSTTKFAYSVTNLGNYSLSINIEDNSIASIENNIIKPKKVGETKITTIINSTPEIKKETTLIILDCVKEVNFYITNLDNSIPERYFTDTTYVLEIKQNLLTEENPELFYDNVKNLNLIKKENNSYIFNFEIITHGKFTFTYNSKYVNLSQNYNAYKLPTDFAVNFSNNLLNNNEINLYLFDENYKTQANENNIYNSVNFEIIKQDYSYDEFEVIEINEKPILEISNNNNNNIKAKNEGTTILKVYSKISNVCKNFNINVSKVNLSEVVINNVFYTLNTVQDIKLNENEEYKFEFFASPIYSVNNLTIEFNLNEIDYSNNKIKLINNTLISTVYLKNNNNIVYTLNIYLAENLKLDLKLTYPTTDASLTDNVLTLNLSKNSSVQIISTVIDLNNPNSSLLIGDYEIIYDSNYCSHLDPNINFGAINLEFKSTGSTTITIINLTYNIQTTLTIIII